MTKKEKNQEQENKPRILLCEDDVRIGMLVSTHLNSIGYNVVWKKDGQSGFDEAQNSSAFSLAIIDHMMPKMDGLTLISFLRGMDGWSGVPILMLTSRSDSNTVRSAMKMNVNDYIVKPFEMVNLIKRIKKLIVIPPKESPEQEAAQENSETVAENG